MQSGTTCLEISLAVNIHLSYDPGIPLLNIYPREIKIYAHKKPCMQIFIATLFLMAKTRKQPICPSMGRTEKLLIHTKIYVNVQRIFLSEKTNLKRLYTIWFHLHNKFEAVTL